MYVEVDRLAIAAPIAAAVDERLDLARQRAGGADAFSRALRALGLSDDRARQWVADDLRIDVYVDQRFTAASQPTDAEVARAAAGSAGSVPDARAIARRAPRPRAGATDRPGGRLAVGHPGQDVRADRGDAVTTPSAARAARAWDWRDAARRAALLPVLAAVLAGPGWSILASPAMPGWTRALLLALAALAVVRPHWSPSVLLGVVPLLPVWPTLVPGLPEGIVHLVVVTQAIPWLVFRLAGRRANRSSFVPGWAVLVAVATVSLGVALTPEPWRGSELAHVWRQLQAQVPGLHLRGRSPSGAQRAAGVDRPDGRPALRAHRQVGHDPRDA